MPTLEPAPVLTYSQEDFERIAHAIGNDVADVLQYTNEFEAAARWYRLNIPPAKREDGPTLQLRNKRPEKPEKPSQLRKQRSKKPKKPSEPQQRSKKPKTLSQLRKKAKQVEAAARKLLMHLGISRYSEAPEGPGDRDLMIFLASYGGSSEEKVTQDTTRLGRLGELLEAIDAAKSLEACAHTAWQEAIDFAKLLPKGHRGDVAAIEWIADMMSLYNKITGREPRLSVLRPGPGRGQPAGPFRRFLQAAGEPLKIELASMRSRLRASKRTADRRQK